MKKIKDNINREIHLVLGLEESISRTWLYHPEQSTDSIQFLSNWQWHFSENHNKKLYNLYENRKSPNSQSNVEKAKQSWRNQASWLQAILQSYIHQDIKSSRQYVPARFRKGRGTRDQIANICWIIEKSREFYKNMYFCFISYSLWLCRSQQTVSNSYRDCNTRPSYLFPEKPICRSRSNLYAKANPVWNNWLVQDWERNRVGLSAVTLFV